MLLGRSKQPGRYWHEMRHNQLLPYDRGGYLLDNKKDTIIRNTEALLVACKECGL
jgi:hypothetical protein